MTSSSRRQEGGGGYVKHDNISDRLREWDSDKGRWGSKNMKFLRNVIYGWFQRGLERLGRGKGERGRQYKHFGR